MKRIGIVTFFQSYNYGVWFQAYATQAFLRGRGYDAQIVNYSNLHDDEKLKMAFKGKNSYMGYLISFAKNILFGGMHYYRKGFKKHLNTFYSLSSEHCRYGIRRPRGEPWILYFCCNLASLIKEYLMHRV